MKFFILLLFSSLAMALIPHKLEYALSSSGFELGTEFRVLTKKNDIYTYISNAQTKGFAKLIVDYKISATSKFVLDNGIKTLEFYLLENKNSKVKKDIKVHNINSKIAFVDQLDIFLAIGYDLKNNNTLAYKLNDGVDIKEYKFKVIGEEKMQILGNDINVIKVIGDKQITAYFAPKYDYIPVLIQKKNWQYRLKKYSAK